MSSEIAGAEPGGGVVEEKYVGMCVSVKPSVQEQLRVVAKAKNSTVSQIFRELVTRGLPLVHNDGTHVPIILKVPASLRGDPEQLRAWFVPRVEAVVASLGNKVSPAQS